MNKHLLRLTALLCTGVLLAASTLSCSSDNSGNTDDTTDNSQTTTAPVTGPMPDLPDKRWDGQTFTFYYRDSGSGHGILHLEEATGDVLDDAIFTRMQTVSDQFGVTFAVAKTAGDTVANDAVNTILAGDDSYQLIFPHAEFTITYIEAGAALEWSELPWIDVSQPWWSQSAVESLCFGTKMYFMSDDLTHSNMRATKCMAFNKDILTDLNIEIPYELVREGKWTFDKLKEYASVASRDLNGDTSIDIENDRFGYVTNWWCAPINILATAGIRVCSINNDGLLELTINSSRTADVYDAFFAMLDQPYAWCNTKSESESLLSNDTFIDGRAAFINTTLGECELLRDTDFQYGILPDPKFDETVDGYPTLVDGGTNTLIVPVTVKDKEMVSAVMEAICYENYKSVLPVYYETVLQTKVANDADSIEMLDIIRNNRLYDIGYFFAGGNLRYSGYDLTRAQNRNFSTYYAARESAAVAYIEKLNELFTE